MSYDDATILGHIEDQKEAEHYYYGPPRGRPRCPRCGSQDISDRQGGVRPDGDDRPPWLLVCEDCGCEWEEDD